MTETDIKSRPIVFVSGGEGGGGVLSLVRELAPAVAQNLSLDVYHLGLVNLPIMPAHAPSNFFVDSLYVHPNGSGAKVRVISKFHEWVSEKRPSVLLLNDVSQIEEGINVIPEDIKVVFVLHDEGLDYRRPILKFGARLDQVVVVANYLRELLIRDCPLLEGKVITIHNGVRFPVDLGAPRREAITSRTVKILYAGGIDRLKKGVQDLPKLAKKLADTGVPFSLTIAGGGDKKLDKKFERLGVESRIYWTGRLPWREVLVRAGECDLYFLPSRCEPFGLVTVEAMGMGCLPIAYDIESGSREIISHGIDGWLVQFANVERVAKVIGDIITTDRKKIEKMRAAATSKARQTFSMARTATKYSNLIYELIKMPTSLASIQDSAHKRSQRLNVCEFNNATYRLGKLLRRPFRFCARYFPTLVQPVWRKF